jgi:hypothetical protein
MGSGDGFLPALQVCRAAGAFRQPTIHHDD